MRLMLPINGDLVNFIEKNKYINSNEFNIKKFSGYIVLKSYGVYDAIDTNNNDTHPNQRYWAYHRPDWFKFLLNGTYNFVKRTKNENYWFDS